MLLNSEGCYTFGIGIDLPHKVEIAVQMLSDYKDEGILLLEGGADVNPAKYGEKNRYSYCAEDRDYRESALFREAVRLEMPVLGICRGHQLINVLQGGTLYQDLKVDRGKAHSGGHVIDIKDELEEILSEREETYVNSLHHQGIRDLGLGGKVIGVAKDKLVEAVIYERIKTLTVQYHPEFMKDFRYLDYIKARWR